MKTTLLSFLSFLMIAGPLSGQVLFDFETEATSTSFLYFGSSISDQPTTIIDNPNATGVNSSAKVASYIKAAGAETWAGAYAETAPTVDATSGGKICIDVHMDHIGNLAVKLEASITGGSDWITTQANTTVGEWETLCFDLGANGLEDDMTPAAGHVYGQMVMFFDFGSAGTDADVTSYFDNIRLEGGGDPSGEMTTTIFDWETVATSSNYLYFGSVYSDMPAGIIANPNPTGVNESATVLEYIKGAGAETWAGAYAETAPTVDATSGGKICVDVHMDHIGNLAVKLEASSTGGSNWITIQENSKVGEWETLCFDLGVNGLEDDMTPAAGHIYGQLVVFPDFGTAGADVDVTTYIDNIVLVSEGGGPGESEVTFSVDMGDKTDFGTVYLSGQFNDWSMDANPMEDADGDNVWETTITVVNGSYEYKFQLDQWTQSEELNSSDVCTKTTDDGNGTVFINRSVFINDSGALPTVCYASCYACGGSVKITWNLNMQNESVSDLGVYVAGGEYFGHAELPAMTDEDGDGIYTITLEREIGFTTDYTFLNGICLPDWSCKENIAGQDCAVDPFNDRNLAPVMEDTEINTCFGICSTDGSCGSTTDKFNVTFRVDMNDETVGSEGVFLSGAAINSWSPDATPMEDADGNGVYEVTVELPSSIIEYKFVNSGVYEDVTLDDCTVQDPSGQFINRILLLEPQDSILPPYKFASCELSTVGLNDLAFDEDMFEINPSISSTYTEVRWNGTEDRVISVFNMQGSLVENITVPANQNTYRMDLTEYTSGLYIVRMTTDSKMGSKRLIVGN